MSYDTSVRFTCGCGTQADGSLQGGGAQTPPGWLVVQVLAPDRVVVHALVCSMACARKAVGLAGVEVIGRPGLSLAGRLS